MAMLVPFTPPPMTTTSADLSTERYLMENAAWTFRLSFSSPALTEVA